MLPGARLRLPHGAHVAWRATDPRTSGSAVSGLHPSAVVIPVVVAYELVALGWRAYWRVVALVSEQKIVEAVKADPVVKAVMAGGASGSKTVTTAAGDEVAAPTTTQEEDRGTAGQRAVNMVWESTQRQIALSVIGSSLFTSVVISVFGGMLNIPTDLRLAAAVFLFGVANLVTGFYFGRTNHQRVGGVWQGR